MSGACAVMGLALYSFRGVQSILVSHSKIPAPAEIHFQRGVLKDVVLSSKECSVEGDMLFLVPCNLSFNRGQPGEEAINYGLQMSGC